MPKLALLADDGTVQLADGDPVPVPSPDEQLAELFPYVLAVEGSPTGDGREFVGEAVVWRDLPLPFMATDTTAPGHDGAVLVGHITEIFREESKIMGMIKLMDDVSNERVLYLQGLVRTGRLPGVSVDMDDVDGEIRFNEEKMFAEGYDEETGETIMPMFSDRELFTSARIMGATAVPFPAFAEAQQQIPDAVIASGGVLAGRLTLAPSIMAASFSIADDYEAVSAVIADQDEAIVDAFKRIAVAAGALPEDEEPAADEVDMDDLVASISPPVLPPAAWFTNPNIDEPFSGVRVTDEGRIFGYLALWNTCHVGINDSCVMAPRTQSNYSGFVGPEILTAEGGRVAVGSITTCSGHADGGASPARAKEHYDHTGFVGADIVTGEDRHGIWFSGGIRSTVTPAQLRELMGAKVSGDWRRIGGALELIAVASVNSPGFPTIRASITAGAVTSLVLTASAPCTRSRRDELKAEHLAFKVGRHPAQIAAHRDSIAASVGRDAASRRAAVIASVKG